jgi:hypothetical protein
MTNTDIMTLLIGGVISLLGVIFLMGFIFANREKVGKPSVFLVLIVFLFFVSGVCLLEYQILANLIQKGFSPITLDSKEQLLPEICKIQTLPIENSAFNLMEIKPDFLIGKRVSGKFITGFNKSHPVEGRIVSVWLYNGSAKFVFLVITSDNSFKTVSSDTCKLMD